MPFWLSRPPPSIAMHKTGHITFVKIDHEIIFTFIALFKIGSYKLLVKVRAVINYLWKYVHKVVNLTVSNPVKEKCKLTDRLDMVLTVLTRPNKSNSSKAMFFCFFFFFFLYFKEFSSTSLLKYNLWLSYINTLLLIGKCLLLKI